MTALWHKRLLALSVAVIVTAAFCAIWQFEHTLRHGQTVLLELAPVDPRSIMQGDYMALAFKLDRELPDDAAQSTYALLQLDQNRIASIHSLADELPVDDKSALQPVLIRPQRFGATLGPNGFFFTEGSAQTYENARYGKFRVDANGKALLTALLDENLQLLGENKR